MKRIAIFLLAIIAIVSTMAYLYLNYIANYNNAQKNNRQFQIYQEQEMTGAEITTLINKVIDYNKQNDVKQDNKGQYIDNGTNSLNMDIKFIDDDITYNIEKIYQKGMNLFLSYYRDIKFKCKKVQYHSSTNKISYMLIEQITQ